MRNPHPVPTRWPLQSVLLAAATITTVIPAQPQDPPKIWSGEQLEQNLAGFTKAEVAEHWAQIRLLLENEDVAGPAIMDKVHGNHAEYVLRIERLLTQLDDERWQTREAAETKLVEIGGRARDLIVKNSKFGSVEKRIRAARAVMAIEQRGTEDEKRQVKYVRGMVRTALYMKPSPRMAKALVSCLRHTDSVVIEGALRALGRHADETHVEFLEKRILAGGQSPEAALGALASIQGPAALESALRLLASDKLKPTHRVLLLRAVCAREDAEKAAEKLATFEAPLARAAAGLKLGLAQGAAARLRISLSDSSTIEGLFLGFVGDMFRLADCALVGRDQDGKETVVPLGIPILKIPMTGADRLNFVGTTVEQDPKACRLFLLQGSVIAGVLLGIDAESVSIDSRLFGKVTFKRTEVQGLTIDPKLDRLLGGSTTNDKLRLRDKTSITGSVATVDATNITLTDGKTVPLANVAGLLFKRPRQQAHTIDDRIYARIHTAHGDKVLCDLVKASSDQIGIVTDNIGAHVLKKGDISIIELAVGGGAMWGFTIVADYSDNRIVEFDDQGNEVFSLEDMLGVWDVECLENGNLLVTEFSVNKVSEITRDKKVVWSFEDVKNPYDADRLPNGNTLIADTYGRRVIEVDKSGKIVWIFEKNVQPYDVDRLANGNTLIVDGSEDRIIEVNPKGKIVWELKNIVSCHDADRLPNGNTLITLRMAHKVQEVDPTGKVVMELTGLATPSDADRLPNGNTLVSENGRVREFDRRGNEIWRKDVTWAVEANRY